MGSWLEDHQTEINRAGLIVLILALLFASYKLAPLLNPYKTPVGCTPTAEHFIAVNVTRCDGGKVCVMWLGGWDSQFAANFNVTINGNSTIYQKPGRCNYIAKIEAPPNASYVVDGFDITVKSYRPIADGTI